MSDETRDTLPPGSVDREAETSPHHEIPPAPLAAIEGAPDWAREFFSRLDARLEPIASVHQVVNQLRGSLDCAVEEWKRQNDRRKSEIADIEGRVDGHDADIEGLRRQLKEERKRIDAIERELDRWAKIGGPPS